MDSWSNEEIKALAKGVKLMKLGEWKKGAATWEFVSVEYPVLHHQTWEELRDMAGYMDEVWYYKMKHIMEKILQL